MARALPPLSALSAVPAAPTGCTITVKPGTSERLVLVRIGNHIFDHNHSVTKLAATAQRETIAAFELAFKTDAGGVGDFVKAYKKEYVGNDYILEVRLQDRVFPKDPYAYPTTHMQPVDMLIRAFNATRTEDYGPVTFLPIAGLPPRPAGAYPVIF